MRRSRCFVTPVQPDSITWMIFAAHSPPKSPSQYQFLSRTVRKPNTAKPRPSKRGAKKPRGCSCALLSNLCFFVISTCNRYLAYLFRQPSHSTFPRLLSPLRMSRKLAPEANRYVETLFPCPSPRLSVLDHSAINCVEIQCLQTVFQNQALVANC